MNKPDTIFEHMPDEEFQALARRRFALCGRRLPAGVCMRVLGHAGDCDASGEHLAVTQADAARLPTVWPEETWIGKVGLQIGSGIKWVVGGTADFIDQRWRHFAYASMCLLLPPVLREVVLVVVVAELYYKEAQARKRKKHVCAACSKCGHVECHPTTGVYR